MAKYTPEQRAERAAARKAAKAAYLASLTPEQLAALKAEQAERRAQRNAERTQALISKLRKEMGLPEPPTWDELNGLIEGEQRHIAFNFLVYLQQLTRLTDNDYCKLTNDMATNSNGLSTPYTAPTTGGNPAQTYEQITARIKSKTKGKPTPDNAAIGIALIKQDNPIQRALCLAALGEHRDTHELKIQGIPEKMARSPLYLATLFALANLQYRQSTQTGLIQSQPNDHGGQSITNMYGLGRIQSYDRQGQRIELSSIGLPFKELFRLVTNRQRPTDKEYWDFYDFVKRLHSTIVKVRIGNGLAEHIQAIEAPLIEFRGMFWEKGDTTNKPQDGFICLGLNPVFHDFTKGFALFPSDTLQLLAKATPKRTAAHYVLMNRLAIAPRFKPYTLYIDRDLYEDMYLSEEFKKNPKRVEGKLLGILDALQAIGLIQSYTTDTRPVRGDFRLYKAVVNLNPHFGTKTKAKPSTPDTVN